MIGDTASSLSSPYDIGKADTTIEATAVEDTSITLDIDLGNDKSSQIKVTLESDALVGDKLIRKNVVNNVFTN